MAMNPRKGKGKGKGKGGKPDINHILSQLPGKGGKPPTPPGGKPGDWSCPNCGDLVFASKHACKMCGTPKPSMCGGKGWEGKNLSFPPGGKPGDWQCPSCGDLVFAAKSECKLCGTAKPPVVD